jgi:hypothetical protein
VWTLVAWDASWSTTYEDLLGTNRPFAKPIPLPVSFKNSFSVCVIQVALYNTQFLCCNEGELTVASNNGQYANADTQHYLPDVTLISQCHYCAKLAGDGGFSRRCMGARRPL